MGEDPNAGKSSKEILIAYLVVLWESERENAERISRRIELLTGAMVALMGLSFFGVDWLYEVPSTSMLIWAPYTVWLLHIGLLAVVLLFARSLGILYGRRESVRTATEILEIKPQDVGSPTRATLISKLSRAYNYLKLRNEEARSTLRAAQAWFAGGFTLLLLLLMSYLVLSAHRKAIPKETDNDSTNSPRIVDDEANAERR